MGQVTRASVAKRDSGYLRPMFGRWKKKGDHHADKQRGDAHALDREGDPRGGVQDEAYRHAEPTDVVEADGVAMSGPGGAPQEGLSADERRDLNR
jgi:hypothetical protein